MKSLFFLIFTFLFIQQFFSQKDEIVWSEKKQLKDVYSTNIIAASGDIVFSINELMSVLGFSKGFVLISNNLHSNKENKRLFLDKDFSKISHKDLVFLKCILKGDILHLFWSKKYLKPNENDILYFEKIDLNLNVINEIKPILQLSFKFEGLRRFSVVPYSVFLSNDDIDDYFIYGTEEVGYIHPKHVVTFVYYKISFDGVVKVDYKNFSNRVVLPYINYKNHNNSSYTLLSNGVVVSIKHYKNTYPEKIKYVEGVNSNLRVSLIDMNSSKIDSIKIISDNKDIFDCHLVHYNGLYKIVGFYTELDLNSLPVNLGYFTIDLDENSSRKINYIPLDIIIDKNDFKSSIDNKLTDFGLSLENISIDQDRNIYMTGSFFLDEYRTTTKRNIFAIKIDKNDNIVWKKVIDRNIKANTFFTYDINVVCIGDKQRIIFNNNPNSKLPIEKQFYDYNLKNLRIVDLDNNGNVLETNVNLNLKNIGFDQEVDIEVIDGDFLIFKQKKQFGIGNFIE